MNSNPGPNPGPDPGPNPTPSSSLIKFGVVDKIASSASDSDLFQSFGVPVDASNPGYNPISFSHWTFSAGHLAIFEFMSDLKHNWTKEEKNRME